MAVGTDKRWMASADGKRWMAPAAWVVIVVGLVFGARTCSRNNKEHDAMQEDINNSIIKIEAVDSRVDIVDGRVTQKEQALKDSIALLNNRLKELDNCCASKKNEKTVQKPNRPVSGNRVVRREPYNAGNDDCGCQGVNMSNSTNTGTIVVCPDCTPNAVETSNCGDCGTATVVLDNGSVNNGTIVVGGCGATDVEQPKKKDVKTWKMSFTTKVYGTTR